MVDTRNWIGYALAGAGVFLVVLCLVTTGYGFESWAWISGIGAVILFVIGIAVVAAEHRRIRSGLPGPIVG